MKNPSKLKTGGLFIAQLYGGQYFGKRIVVVIDTAPGLVTVLPIRTSNLHRSCRTSLIIPQSQSAVGRKLSVDCGTMITLRRDALLRQVGTMSDADILQIKEKTQ